MMKNILILIFLLSAINTMAQTGIGTASPDVSAKLEVNSTNKGLLTPRMTSAQRTAISSPANGLLVYQTDGVAGFYLNTGTSASPVWARINTDWVRSGNDIAYTAGNISTTGNLTGGNVATSKISGFVSNVTAEASSRTLTSSDNGMVLRCTAALTLTLPTAGTLPEGFNCMVVQFAANSQVTFSGTFSNRNGFNKTAGQYAIATVLYTGGVYIVSGEMSN
ncbi:MAG: hypothetical protein RLZZ619_932 [Pseudomonadota bacterium]|jgi:hypothetical protein